MKNYTLTGEMLLQVAFVHHGRRTTSADEGQMKAPSPFSFRQACSRYVCLHFGPEKVSTAVSSSGPTESKRSQGKTFSGDRITRVNALFCARMKTRHGIQDAFMIVVYSSCLGKRQPRM
jgi:hypothetical protein